MSVGSNSGSSAVGQYEIFVAYNSANLDDVLAICRVLKQRNFEYWIDCERIAPGHKWRPAVRDAIGKVQVALFFFGPQGLGPHQQAELEFVLKQCTDLDKRIIPVILPGGEVPDEIGLTDVVKVEFKNASTDVKAFESLVRGIRGVELQQPHGQYQIHIEVPEHIGTVSGTDLCGVFVGSPNTPMSVTHLISDCLEQRDAKVLQSHDATQPHYEADLERAIRAASVLVADCSSVACTGQPDATVMYAIGLADALGKYIVLVADNNHPPPNLPSFKANLGQAKVDKENALVFYDLQNARNSEFVDTLNSVFTALFNELTYPYVVPRQSRGIGVAFADVFHLRVAFWDRLERVLWYGIFVDQFLRELSKHVSRIQQILDLESHLVSQTFSDKTGMTPLATLNALRTVRDQFAKDQFTAIEGDFQKLHPDAGIEDAFDVLIENAQGVACEYLRDAKEFCRYTIDAIDATSAAYDTVLSHLNQSTLSAEFQIERLKTDAVFLATCVDQVHSQVNAMMRKFIDLIGNGHQREGTEHGNSQAISV